MHSPTMIFRVFAASLPRGRASGARYSVFLFFCRGLLVVVLSFRDFVTRGLLVVVLSFPEIVTCCASRTCRTSMPMTRMGSPSRWVDAAGYNCRTAASPDASLPNRGHVRQASSPVPAVDKAIDYQA